MTLEENTDPIVGTAAGVPFLAVPPEVESGPAPVLAVWHLMDPPRSEAAMAAALPLAGVPAWRIYFGLPMFGRRMPAGGPDEIMRLGAEDAMLNLFVPIVEQAAAEFSAALSELRARLPLDDGPIGVMGGSAGGAVALSVLAEGSTQVSAAALVNPVVVPAAMIATGERLFGMTYNWSDQARAANDRLNFVVRAGEIASRNPKPAILLVGGAEDDRENREGLADLYEALSVGYEGSEQLGFVIVPDMGHPLAEEPGIEPAPQTEGAARVDAAMTEWFVRHLAPTGSTG